MKICSIVLATFLFAAPMAIAEDESMLLKFEGEWRSEGVAFGAPTKGWMTWRLTLDDQFVRLDYKIQWQSKSDVTQVFQGVAYYKVGGGDKFDAFWADSIGDLHPISAEREGDALIAYWGVDGGKQGRTRYELLAPGKMEVTDWLKSPEEWREFNRNVFTRVLD